MNDLNLFNIFSTLIIFFSNFSHYKNRFSMPGKSEGLYYSFDLGPVHFVAISTEVYYYLNYGFQPLIKQYKWLVNDLQV